MTPAARTQAAIDLLDAIVAAAVDNGAAADTLIARYFAQRRYAGSKDRRAVRELVYAAIRLLGERPANGRAAMVALAKTDPAIAATFDGSTHAPLPIAADEDTATPGIAPAWLIERLSASGLSAEEQGALTGRAPLDVRINTLLGPADAIAAETARFSERAPGAIAIRTRASAFACTPSGTPALSRPKSRMSSGR